MKYKLITILFLLCSSLLKAQTIDDTTAVTPVPEPSKEAKNNFAVFGNAEMIYFSDKNNSQFGKVSFKPIFLWKISDKLFEIGRASCRERV